MTWPGPFPGPRRGQSPEAAVTTPPKQPLTWPHQPTDARQAPRTPYHYPHDRVKWPQGDLEWLVAIGQLPADPVPLPPAGTGGLVETGQLFLYGGSLVNSSTNASVVTIRDGADATGGFLAQVNVAASSNANLSLPNIGVICEIGLWVVVAGGSVTGALYVAHMWKYPFTPYTE